MSDDKWIIKDPDGKEYVLSHEPTPLYASPDELMVFIRPPRRHWKVRVVLIREMVVSDWPVCKHIISERTVENSKQRLDDGPVV